MGHGLFCRPTPMILFIAILSVLLGTDNVAAGPISKLPIARAGKPASAIVVADSAGEMSKFATTELQKYLRILSGAEIPVISESQISSRPGNETLLLVGGPQASKTIRSAKWLSFAGLKPEGFVIKAGRLGNHSALIVGGNDDISTLYGVYDLIEQLGVTFQLNRDFIPALQLDLSVPGLSLRKEPAFARRGFLLQDGGYENLTLFSF